MKKQTKYITVCPVADPEYYFRAELARGRYSARKASKYFNTYNYADKEKGQFVQYIRRVV